jgi:hypothetical protein
MPDGLSSYFGESTNRAPDVRTFPDGSLRQWQPDPNASGGGYWIVVAQSSKAKATDKRYFQGPNGEEVEYDPETGKSRVIYKGESTTANKYREFGGNLYVEDPSAPNGLRLVLEKSSGGGGLSLAQQMQQQRDRLWQQVARGEIPMKDAISSFDEWYAVNVKMPSELNVFPMTKQFADQFAGGLNQMTGGQSNWTGDAFYMSEIPQFAEMGAAKALAGISPVAASIAGAPMPQPPATPPAEVLASVPYQGPQAQPTPINEPPIAVPGTRRGGFMQ